MGENIDYTGYQKEHKKKKKGTKKVTYNPTSPKINIVHIFRNFSSMQIFIFYKYINIFLGIKFFLAKYTVYIQNIS